MQSILRKTSELHSASGVVRTLLTLLADNDFSVGEITRCLEKDPALTARVLTVVNSAGFGTTRTVSSLQQAVALLGRRKLRNVVLTFSVVERLTRGLDAAVYCEYWKRTLTTSLVADMLAKQVRVDANDAYTAGLLADIGVLALAQFEPERYLPLFKENAHGSALVSAERSAFGFDHAELGSRMLETWSFPHNLTMAVAAHHDSDESQLHCLSRLVHAGNLMPEAIWIADSESFYTAYGCFEDSFDFTIDSFVGFAVEVNELVATEACAYGLDGVQAVDCDGLRKAAEGLLEGDPAT